MREMKQAKSTRRARSKLTPKSKTQKNRPTRKLIKEKDININITLDVRDSSQSGQISDLPVNLEESETKITVNKYQKGILNPKEGTENPSKRVKKSVSKRNKLKGLGGQHKLRTSRDESVNIREKSVVEDTDAQTKNYIDKTEENKPENDILPVEIEAPKSDSIKAQIQPSESKTRNPRAKNSINDTFENAKSFGSTPKTKIATKKKSLKKDDSNAALIRSPHESNADSNPKTLDAETPSSNNSILNIGNEAQRGQNITHSLSTQHPSSDSIKEEPPIENISEKIKKKENEVNITTACKSETAQCDAKIGKVPCKDNKNVEMNEYKLSKASEVGSGMVLDHQIENKYLQEKIEDSENAKSAFKTESSNLIEKKVENFSPKLAASKKKCDCSKNSNLSLSVLAKDCDICSKKFGGKNKSNSQKRLLGLDNNNLFGTPKTKTRKE